MTHERADEIFERFDTAEVNTTDEKDLMLAYHEHKLTPGSSEFDRARKLVAIRMLADDN